MASVVTPTSRKASLFGLQNAGNESQMNTITAQEIKRRGISAVDDSMETGPVLVMLNNQPKYVVMREDQYRELIEARDEAHRARVQASLRDLKSGRVNRGSAEDLIKELALDS